MNCTFQFVGESGARFLYRCTACGREVRGNSREQAPGANCFVNGADVSRIRTFPFNSTVAIGPIPDGPGTELEALLKEYGIKKLGCGSCEAMAAKMNAWGVAGCQEHRAEILGQLQAGYDAAGVFEKIKAGTRAVAKGLPKSLEGMLDESILRAATKQLINPVRHLVYHVGPFAGNSVWRWNVAEILKRIDLFNGKRAVAIITGDGMDSPDEVKRAFAGHVENFEVFPNDPKLREVVSRPWLFDQIASTAQNEITFTAHAKGVTRPLDGTTARWAEIQYETCLDYMPLVERMLQGYPILGSFKRVGRSFFMPSKSQWHYSGTYYWLRNSQVFNRDWRTIDQKLYGTESWPGIHFSAAEGGCLFHENPDMNLYNPDYMAKVEAEYILWKEAVERAYPPR